MFPDTKISDFAENENSFQLHALNKLDISPLSIFFKNSMFKGDNTNTRVAFTAIDVFMPKFIDDNLSYINYIAQSPHFDTIQFKDGEFFHASDRCDDKTFDTLDELKDFIYKNRGKIIIAHSIQESVNLETLTKRYNFKYKFIDDPAGERDAKISEVIDDPEPIPAPDKSDDLPF